MTLSVRLNDTNFKPISGKVLTQITGMPTNITGRGQSGYCSRSQERMRSLNRARIGGVLELLIEPGFVDPADRDLFVVDPDIVCADRLNVVERNDE